jgi:hypothetical protein
MNIINLRKHVRRTTDTRPNGDRRNAANQANASNMQDNESTLAKLNRRKAERRLKDRRKQMPNTQQGNEILPPDTRYARFKLTRGERNLIQDMFLSDLEDKK